MAGKITYHELEQRIKALEEKLQESELERQTILDLEPHHCVIQDLDNRILWANKAACESIDMPREDLVGKHCYKIWAKRKHPCPDCPVIESVQAGKPQSLLKTTPDGRTWQIRGYPLRDKQGRITRAMEVTEDITERKLAEKTLRDNERQKSLILNSTAEMVAYYDKDLRVIWANRASSESVGKSFEELVGLHCYEIWPQRDDPCPDCPVLKARDTKRPQQCERQTPDGRHWFIRGYPVLDENGRIVGLAEFTQDITERKKIEKDLLFKSAIVEQTSDSIICTDDSFRISYMNKSAEVLFGWSFDEVKDKTPDRFNAEPHSDDIQNKIYKTVSSGKTYEGITLNVRKDNTTFYCHHRICPLQDENGNIYGYMGSQRDISDLIKKEKALSEAEKNLQRTLDATTDGIWTWNFKTNDLFFSPKYYTMLGYDPNAFEACYENWLKLIHPDDQKNAIAVAAEFLKTKPDFYENTFRLKTKKGDYRWIHAHARVVERDEKGDAVYLIGNHEDITERKQTEEELRKSEERFRILSQAGFEGVVVHEKGYIVYANDQYYEMFGYMPVELHDIDAIERTVTPDSIGKIKKKIASGDLGPYEVSGVKKDGTQFPIELRAREITWHGQTVRITAIRDLSRYREAEAALAASKALLDSVGRMARVGGWELDAQTLNVRWTEETYNIHEVPLDYKPPLKDAINFFHPEDRDRLSQAIQRALDVGEPYDMEVRFITAKGRQLWTRTACQPQVVNGKTVKLQGTFQDITDRKLAEDRLRASEALLSSTQQISHVGSWVLDPSSNQLTWSDEVYRIFGIEPHGFAHTCEAFLDTVHPDDRSAVDAGYSSSLQEGQDSYEIEHRIIRQDTREIRHVYERCIHERDKTGSVLRSVGMVQDITERKSLESQLRQVQKMESIGTLAGGIAHDFNNALTPILVQTELAKMTISADSPVQEGLDEVMKAGHRAKDLVKQILTFSRQSEQQRLPVDLTPIVKENLKLLRSSIPTTIEIRQDIAEVSCWVLADPTQIHQIIMNLCTNASQAMEEMGSVMEVGLKRVELNGKRARSYPNIEAGSYVMLTVSDTGSGIEPELMEKIFDPFFTTKPIAKGTGMGLSVVHGIVQSHGGDITVQSEPGKGSTFTVLLPRLEQKVENELENIDQSVPTGNELIMFVDDEAPMVKAGEQVLKRLGYQVDVKTSAVEALAAFRERPDKYDLIMTDMTMPAMTGDNLARALMNIRPNIPVIICTGYSHQMDEEKALAMGIKAFVMKPFAIKDIAETVRRVLDSDASKS
jgi:PAS domain S-box-containing protein